jgi:hypothetical protein
MLLSESQSDLPRLESIGFNRKQLKCETEIEASPELIWQILTDLSAFPEWNPFIKGASGTLKKGEKLTVTMHPTGGRATTFKTTVLSVEPNRELRWIGHLGLPGLFDGEHFFGLNPLTSSRTLFVQREQFGGVLLPFLVGMLKRETSRGFSEMNLALKARAERRTAQS